MNLIHFYHIYADPSGHWQSIVQQHFLCLHNFGLYEALAEIRVGIVGERTERVVEYLSQFDKVRIIADERTGFEQVTLNKLHLYAKDNDCLLYYAHTKGASDPSLVNQAWCRSMEFYTCANWQVMTNALELNDTAGCHWLTTEKYPFIQDANNPKGFSYYAGNYWWAKSAYIAKLPRIGNEHRWAAEHWIGKGKPDAYDINPTFPNLNPLTLQLTW
jgi:hypothetical protein